MWPATSDRSKPAVVGTGRQGRLAGRGVGLGAPASPVRAPPLVADGTSLPKVTDDTLKRLDPKGSELTQGAPGRPDRPQAARAQGLPTGPLNGKDPYEPAAAIDRFFSAAKGKPSEDVIVTTGERAPYAMPAAAWAARAGDAVLFVKQG